MLLFQLGLELLHFGFENTPPERQFPCIEKQYEYEIYQSGQTTDGAYKTDACNRKHYDSLDRPHRDHHHHHHEDGKERPPCMYKEHVGTCTITSIEYANTEDDRLNIFAEFKPRAAKQRTADFNQQLVIEDIPVTEEYFVEHNMYMGMQTTCVRRMLRYADTENCYAADWLFPDLDKDRKGGIYGSSDDPEEHNHG